MRRKRGLVGGLLRTGRAHAKAGSARGETARSELAATCDNLLRSVDKLWPRLPLGWASARDVWDNAGTVKDDRDMLRDQVADRAARLTFSSTLRGLPAGWKR